MKNNVYLHLDFFSPTVYTKPVGDQSDSPAYLIVQPYLFTDPSMDCPDLFSYINDIAGDIPADYGFILLDSSEHNAQAVWDTACPVPFPFNVQITSGGNVINSMGGELGYRFADSAAQVQWMINSKSSRAVTIEQFTSTLDFLPLSDAQIENWWNGLKVILTAYVERSGATYSGVTKNGVKVFTDEMLNFHADPAQWNLKDLVIELGKRKQPPALAHGAVAPVVPDFTRTQKLNALKNFVAAIREIEGDSERKGFLRDLALPSVTLTAGNLADIKGMSDVNLSKLLGTDKGYLRTLCKSFSELYRAAAGDEVAKLRELESALKNYFYFGERTRLEAMPPEITTLPLRDPDALSDAPLVAVPAISLTGQVIKTDGHATLRVNNVVLSNAEFTENVRVLKENTRVNDSAAFIRPLSTMQFVDAADWSALQGALGIAHEREFKELWGLYGPLGKASYLPSNSVAGKSEIYLQADDLFVYKVPQFFLDGLLSTPRVDYTRNFAKENPQCIAANYPADIINYSLIKIVDQQPTDIISNYLRGFTPALLLKVTAQKLDLPDDPVAPSDAPVAPSDDPVAPSDEVLWLYKLSAKAQYDNGVLFNLDLARYLYDDADSVFKQPVLYSFRLLIDKEKPLELTILSGIKNDRDELLEIVVAQPAKNLKKEIYDLLIFPKDLLTSWNSAKGFYFNTLLHKRPLLDPMLLQKNYFQFKFHQSVNGVNSYLRLKLAPSSTFVSTEIPGPGDGVQPVLYDHTNFNKLRVTLTDGAGSSIAVNKSDALRPVFEYFDSHETSLVAIYKILHRFSEELGSRGFDKVNLGMLETEWSRYLLCRSCGSPHFFSGKPENQYSVRLTTENSPALFLNQSSNVSNIALLNVPVTGGGKAIPALTFQIDRRQNKITLLLRKEYFIEIASQAKEGAAYRTLYEAVNDLLGAKEVTMMAEGWAFDNSRFDLALGEAVHPEMANAIPSLVPFLKRTVKDCPLDAEKLRDVVRGAFDKADLKKFVDAVKAFSADIEIELPLPPALLTASLIRVRLNIQRDPAKTVAFNFSTGVKEADLTPEPWDTVHSDVDSSDYRPWLEETTIAPRALERLSHILSPHDPAEMESLPLPIGGDLFYSSSFITVRQDDENAGILSHDPRTASQLTLILGENMGFTALNYSLHSPVTSTSNYGDLFYIPYAIQPLRALNELNNEVNTFLFAQYCMKVLSALSYPTRAKENLSWLVGNFSWGAADAASLDENLLKLSTMQCARRVLKNIIAPQLARLVTYVDDRDIEPESNAEYRPAYKLLRTIYSDKNVPGATIEYFTSLFTAKPEIFVTAKGFGLGLVKNTFEKNGSMVRAEFDTLFSLQLNKVIKRSTDEGKSILRQVNTTFDFTSIFKIDKEGEYRMFVDVLDDEMYDNEFEIAPTRNGGFDEIKLKHNRRLASEDGQNLYVENKTGNELINLVHYVADWKELEEEGGREFYLLPSRRPPQKPMSVKPFEKVYYKTDNLATAAGQIAGAMLSEVDRMLSGKYSADYARPDLPELKTAAERVDRWTATAGNPGMKKGYLGKVSTLSVPPAQWRRYDTYISVYTFLIDPDEEAGDISDNEPFLGFENDKINVFYKKSDVQDRMEIAGGPPEERKDITLFVNLFEDYKKRSKGEEVGKRDPLTIRQILDATQEEAGLTNVLMATLKPLHESGEVVRDAMADLKGSITITRDGAQWRCELEPKGNTQLIGACLFADIINDGGKNSGRYYLSVAMLADPWSHQKVRVQIDRNSRDFNHDGDPDINPVFEMFSEFSDWADQGQVMLDYNYWDGEGQDNIQLNLYPEDLSRVMYGAAVADAYHLGIEGDKELPDFFKTAMDISRYDYTVLEKRLVRVFISHRTATSQVFELSKISSNTFINAVNAGRVAYRDEFIKETEDFGADDPGRRNKLMITGNVTASTPFIRIVVLDEMGQVPVLSLNLQLQWE